MKAKKVLVVCLGLAFLMFFSTSMAQADECCAFNPLFLPFAIAGAAVGTAAAIASAPFYPYPYYYGPAYYGPAYYGPAYYPPPPGPYYGYGPRPRVWVRGHNDPNGNWIPGHWRPARWIEGHKTSDGRWIRGHWG